MFILLIAALFVVSGDVFFTFQIGGFTIRIFQLLVLPLVAQGAWHSISGLNPQRVPVGFKMALVWGCFVVAFVPNAVFLPRNIFYAGWMIFDVLLVLGITQLIDTPRKLNVLLRWYIYSFVFSALFGLIQISLPLMGLPGLLVEQWWFPGRLARINGFTYEPSYYATYMLTGWVLVDYLRYRKISPVRGMNVIAWLITAALFLSGSRMGWLMMLAWLTLRIYWLMSDQGFRWITKKVVFAGILPFLLVPYALARLQISSDDLRFLASGVETLDSSSSHSSGERIDVFKETLNVFYEHPLIGVSLGGVATEIGHMRHNDVFDNESIKDNEGICTTAEILAACGVLGFIPYFLYMKRLTWTTISVADQSELGMIVKALGWSLLFLLLILQFNATILRSYVWLHIGILSAGYAVFVLAKTAGHVVDLRSESSLGNSEPTAAG
jgi:O-antigen ligase